MDTTPHPSGDPDQFAATTDAVDADPQAGSGENPIGDTGEVVGDRLDDKHSGQDEFVADEAPAEPIVGSGMPTSNPGPGGSPV